LELDGAQFGEISPRLTLNFPESMLKAGGSTRKVLPSQSPFLSCQTGILRLTNHERPNFAPSVQSASISPSVGYCELVSW